MSIFSEFLGDPAALPRTSEKGKEKTNINSSSVAAHLIMTQMKSTAYGVSKLSLTQ